MAIRRFHWDVVNDCVLHETDENGDTLVQYTHEPSNFGPLLSENRDGAESYHHYDAIGSTTMLTDDAGTVTDTFTFDAWGNQVARTGTTETPYTWVGRWGYQDDAATTGGYYIRARSNQPSVARWMSIDPLYSLRDFALAYSYVNNTPVFGIDPTGQWRQLPDQPDIWMAEAEDKFPDLVKLVDPFLNTTKNASCIRPLGSPFNPIPIGPFNPPLADDWKAGKPTPCALYDVSNLTATKGVEFSASIGADINGYIIAAGSFYGVKYTNFDDKRLATQMLVDAQWGNTPLQDVIIVGHSFNQVLSIGGSTLGVQNPTAMHKTIFSLIDLKTRAKVKTYWEWNKNLADAQLGHRPPGCWFTKNATVRLVGCETKSFARSIATELLRGTARAFGTTKATWYFRNQNNNVVSMGWGTYVHATRSWGPDRNLGTAATPEEYNEMKYWESFGAGN